ncbi:putative secreted aspartic proteinase [Rosellinia necatrix]|uniref:Putative secreted aspartic proteinase n=1 Tax=Rosellinia necatrix TaxID=77044 RepID=A0A1S8AAL7_ROSNE|nr:putative secreted aspartic proteinase [Rosellinia necatrix]
MFPFFLCINPPARAPSVSCRTAFKFTPLLICWWFGKVEEGWIERDVIFGCRSEGLTEAKLVTIGTSRNGRKQVVDVLIDTGSFELWVNPLCSKANVPQYCETFGRYDPALSSTAQKMNGNDAFSIKYGSGEVAGHYYKDDIYISGAKIEHQQFGVANTSELVWFGIMGLGRGLGGGFVNYPLVVDSLAAQGFTNTKLFSMDLGRQIGPGAFVTGEMVFGGVDRNKYAGFLKKVPTDPADPHYKVKLNSLAHRGPGARTSTPVTDASLPLPVIVDSGTTLSLLPEAVVQKLAAQFPGARPDGDGGYRVDCAYQRQDGAVDFEFLSATGPVVISVAYSDFVWNSGGDCFLGAAFSKDLGVWILGDSFLRGAYVAFDQTNNALFMSNQLSCGRRSNLVPVPAGPDAAGRIPGACPPARGPPPPPPPPQPATPSPAPSSTRIPTRQAETSSASSRTVTTDSQGFPTATTTSGPHSPEQHETTIVSTTTRIVVYTASAPCPDAAPSCSQPAGGQAATRYETIVTTYCPGHHDHHHDHDHGADSAPTTMIPAPAAPAPPAFVTGQQGPPAPQPPPTAGIAQPEGWDEEEEEERGQLVTTMAFATTATYEVTSCAPGDAGCAPGATTTRAYTVVRTVRVQHASHTGPAGASPSPSPSPSKAISGSGGRNATWGAGGGGEGPVVVAAGADVASTRRLGGVVVACALAWGLVVVVVVAPLVVG